MCEDQDLCAAIGHAAEPGDDENLEQAELDQSQTKTLRKLSDEQVLHFFDRIHNPDIVAPRWQSALEAEVRSRGLRKPS